MLVGSKPANHTWAIILRGPLFTSRMNGRDHPMQQHPSISTVMLKKTHVAVRYESKNMVSEKHKFHPNYPNEFPKQAKISWVFSPSPSKHTHQSLSNPKLLHLSPSTMRTKGLSNRSKRNPHSHERMRFSLSQPRQQTRRCLPEMRRHRRCAPGV